MATFVNVGSVSLNLDAVSHIRWGTSADGGNHVVAVVVTSSPTPLVFQGPEAAKLSDAISMLEAQSERDLDPLANLPLGYVADDEDDLDMLQATLVFQQPDGAA